MRFVMVYSYKKIKYVVSVIKVKSSASSDTEEYFVQDEYCLYLDNMSTTKLSAPYIPGHNLDI